MAKQSKGILTDLGRYFRWPNADGQRNKDRHSNANKRILRLETLESRELLSVVPTLSPFDQIARVIAEISQKTQLLSAQVQIASISQQVQSLAVEVNKITSATNTSHGNEASVTISSTSQIYNAPAPLFSSNSSTSNQLDKIAEQVSATSQQVPSLTVEVKSFTATKDSEGSRTTTPINSNNQVQNVHAQSVSVPSNSSTSNQLDQIAQQVATIAQYVPSLIVEVNNLASTKDSDGSRASTQINPTNQVSNIPVTNVSTPSSLLTSNQLDQIAEQVQIAQQKAAIAQKVSASSVKKDLIYTKANLDPSSINSNTGPIIESNPVGVGGVTIPIEVLGTGGSFSYTIDTNGVIKEKISVGAFGIARFSFYSTSDSNWGFCWSPGGQIIPGIGGSIDAGYGTDGFSTSLNGNVFFVTSGYSDHPKFDSHALDLLTVGDFNRKLDKFDSYPVDWLLGKTNSISDKIYGLYPDGWDFLLNSVGL